MATVIISKAQTFIGIINTRGYPDLRHSYAGIGFCQCILQFGIGISPRSAISGAGGIPFYIKPGEGTSSATPSPPPGGTLSEFCANKLPQIDTINKTARR